MHTSLKLTALLLLVLPSPARADWVSVMPGTFTRVVANADQAAAVRDGEVWLLRDDGSVGKRVGLREGKPTPASHGDSAHEADEILDAFAVSEIERDTDWAVDLVDDERTLAQRRNSRHRPSAVGAAMKTTPLLAAAPDEIWIASGHRLLRVGADGEPSGMRALDGEQRALAAAAQRVLFAGTTGVTMISLDGSSERFVAFASSPTLAVLSPSGRRWAWSSPTGLGWAAEGSAPEATMPTGSVLDLAYCGETLVALLGDSLLAVSPDGTPEVRARELRARRLVCAVGQTMPWLALAQGLLISFDQGRQWETVATPLGLTIADVAVSRHHLWLATNQGLYLSVDAAASSASAMRFVPAAPALVRKGQSTAGSWFSWLPKVSVRASAGFSPSARQLEALALAQFPLEPIRLSVLAAAVDDVAVPAVDLPSRRRPGQVVDLRDPDRDCLDRARRRAVELSLTEPERARSYLARAGRAAWLPELRVLVSRRYGRSESLDVNSSSTALSSPLGIDTVNDIRYEARATWDLAKLIFSTEELAAQTQAIHMAELRRDIENTVNRLYFERRRLVLAGDDGDRVARAVRASEVVAELDGLTGGAFATCTAEHTGHNPMGD